MSSRIRFVLTLLAAFAVAHGAAGSSCSPTLCTSAETLTLPDPSVFAAVADATGDGIPDVIVVTRQYGTVGISVLIGNGDGTFQAPVSTALDSTTPFFLTGDFNGDGKADVIVGDYSGGFVFLSVGDGTFQAPIPFDDGVGATSLAAAHLDSGSTLDLVAGGYNGVAVLRGNGDGTFQAAVVYSGSGATGVTTGDFDGDGFLDVAATAGNLVNIYPGHGDGTLGAPVSTVAGVGATFPVAADFDGDGRLDLVIASSGAAGVLLGRGDFTFEAARDYAAGPWVRAAAVADLDGDGHPDLVVASVQDDYSGAPASLFVLRNAGDGTFSRDASYAAMGVPGMPAIGDLDGNGKPDVVLATAETTAAVAYLNVGGGALAAARLEGTADQSALAAADFDGDGYLDLVAGTDGSNLLIARGQPDGSFVVPPAGAVPTILALAFAAVADFNGDGHLDVVGVSTYYSHQFVFFAGNGDGTFQPAVLYDFPGGFLTTALVVADFNGDGHPDAAFSDANFSSAIGQVTVFLNNGDGTFTLTAAMTLDASLYGGIVAAPFDGDAFPDIVTAGQQPLGPGGTLFFLRGRGDGTFDLPVPSDLTNIPSALAAGELRQPGVEDLVLGFRGNTLATVLLPGNGDGSFGAPQTIAPFSAGQTAVADLDADGKPDVVLSDSMDNLVVIRNLGGGSFGTPERSPDSGATGPIVIGDVEGNGTPDVLVGSSPLGVVVLKNARLGAGLYATQAVVGSDAEWPVRAAGYGPLTYQWRKGGVALSDGGRISGSQTGTLTISPVSFSDAGSYDVLVTDSCGQTTSNSATLSVEFADVPVSSPFHDDILSIAAAGITSGCGGGNYCPTSPVRRDQMAVFLLKSEHGSSYTPPACSGVFSDVPCPSPFADWIERLASEGVTSGCGGGNYCPASSVTRAQMAVFLLKTKNGSSYVPPTATGLFGDVPVGSFAADFIEALYNQGITGGCQASPLLYCPGNSVLRQQMATFLVRTFAP